MYQCVTPVKQLKFSPSYKSRQDRQEEVCCSVCRILFCCSQHRETHEDAEHGKMHAETARQQRNVRKGKKPLVCVVCCQVFISGLFVNEPCKSVSGHDRIDDTTRGASHVLVIIPEWAVAKYLFQSTGKRKREWDAANDEDLPKAEIQEKNEHCTQKTDRLLFANKVNGTVDNFVEDGNTAQENSFTQKSSIQSILSKQRKTELSAKRDRRVTFSPITAVAITSRESIIKVVPRKTLGEPSPDSGTDTPSAYHFTSEPGTSKQSTALTKQTADPSSEFSPLLPKDDIDCKASTFSPSVEHDGKEICVFSPPLPNEGTNGSPMMEPQMSSTPVCEHQSERRSAPTSDSPFEHQTSEAGSTDGGGIFSSLANIVSCAFQALPSVLNQFFATVKETSDSYQREKETSLGRERRQRRRSATFTPYIPVSVKKRRFMRNNVDR